MRDCAVFGFPDEEFGEQIWAPHVEPQAGAAIDVDSRQGLLSPASTWRAGYKVPKVVEFQAPPCRARNSGKIFKRKLRDLYAEGKLLGDGVRNVASGVFHVIAGRVADANPRISRSARCAIAHRSSTLRRFAPRNDGGESIHATGKVRTVF